MRQLTTIIFDFDGVIGDTVEENKNIVVGLYEEFRHEKADPKKVKRFMGKNVMEIIKELKVPLIKLPYFERKVRQKLAKRIDKVKIFKGIKEVLEHLEKRGCRLGILSSNSQENLHYVLKKNGIDFFDFIYFGSSFFGKGKILARLMKKKDLRSQETIYIGDEIRDIQAAKQNQIEIIAVGWGYNKEKLLKEQNPDYFAAKPKDILKILS